MFDLLLSAYSTISIQDAALFLGMNEDDATNCKFLAFLFGLVQQLLLLYIFYAPCGLYIKSTDLSLRQCTS